MKNYIYITVISIFLWSCSGDNSSESGGGTTVTPENNAPTTPSLVAPIDNLLCIDNSVNFQWNASADSDGDSITYLIEVAEYNQFDGISFTYTSPEINRIFTLEKGIAYYWRVKAIDSKGLASSYSSTFHCYTEGIGVINHLPFTRELIRPTYNSVVQTETITLEWDASDVDVDDTLTYDVYFGNINPPTTKIGDNQTNKTIDVNVEALNNYYWKVVVKDNNGGETIGQVWNFQSN